MRGRGRQVSSKCKSELESAKQEIQRLLAHIRHQDSKIIELHRELFAMDEAA